MIVIAHRLSSVKQCDRLVWLRRGRVEGLGSFDELRQRSTEFRALARLAPCDARSRRPAVPAAAGGGNAVAA